MNPETPYYTAASLTTMRTPLAQAMARVNAQRTEAARQQRDDGGPTLRQLRIANQARIQADREATIGTPGGRGATNEPTVTARPPHVFSGFFCLPVVLAVAVFAGSATGFHW